VKAAATLMSHWVAGVRFDDLPEDVVASTKLRILDVMGLTLAGGETPFGRAVRQASATLHPGADARLWGTPATASMIGAAFVNGALSQALEYDDTHNESIVHMSSPAVAAALAIADTRRASGREVIRAIAIGNEISSRVGSVAPGQFHKRGFHPTGLFAPFGIAWLAAAMLGLDPARMDHAAGITGSFAAGLLQCWVDGTQTKFVHPGWAAQSGITAATLASSGVTGPVEVFEGRFGLFASHLQATDTPPHFGRLTDDLGSTWDSRDASFKPFPVAHVIHPYIDAALRLRERHGLDPARIRRVLCPVAPYIVGIVCEPLAEKRRPNTDSHGRVSLSYTLAETFVRGRMGKDAYAEASLRDPAILALADRIDFVVDETFPGPEQFKGVVIVEMDDGTRLEEIEEHNRGSRTNPMSFDEIAGKFRENAGGVLAPGAIERLIEAILDLDRADDASLLSQLAVPTHA